MLTECSSNLSSAGWDVDVDNATVRSLGSEGNARQLVVIVRVLKGHSFDSRTCMVILY